MLDCWPLPDRVASSQAIVPEGQRAATDATNWVAYAAVGAGALSLATLVVKNYFLARGMTLRITIEGSDQRAIVVNEKGISSDDLKRIIDTLQKSGTGKQSASDPKNPGSSSD